MTTIADIMTRGVAAVGRDETLQAAARRMREMDVGALPVTDGRALAGMITDRDIAIRGVAGESAVVTLTERGLIEESGRSRFGAVVYRTTPLFEKLFGLSGLDELPDASRFDPSPEDERELRQRLLRAGEQRAS